MKKLKQMLYPFLQKCKRLILIIIYNICVHTTKCHENRILIASNTKDYLYGNLLYIYEELKKYDYDICILLKNKGNLFEKVMYSLKIVYYVATSKYILIDDFFPLMYVLKIREGSKFIQVWHALGAYKKVGHSRNDISNSKSLTHKNYTDTIVSSDDIVKNYAEAFGITEEKVHPLGVPRTDLFFSKEEMDKKRKQVYEKYPFLEGKRVILFAPTFRGSRKKVSTLSRRIFEFR